MQDDQSALGELLSVHRPTRVRILITAFICTALLIGALLGALLTYDALKQNAGGVDSAKGSLVCMGASVLFLTLIGSFLVSDFRKWRATRTVKLKIYQRGFTYESEGSGETCRWDEIKDLNYKVIEIRSKHSLPSKVRVVRSILKRDDKLITFAETLDLIKVTKLMTSGQKNR